MLYLLFIPVGIYAFFQVRYYIKYKYKREIVVFVVLFSLSCLYLFFYINEWHLVQPDDLIVHIYEPLVKLLFEHRLRQ